MRWLQRRSWESRNLALQLWQSQRKSRRDKSNARKIEKKETERAEAEEGGGLGRRLPGGGGAAEGKAGGQAGTMNSPLRGLSRKIIGDGCERFGGYQFLILTPLVGHLALGICGGDQRNDGFLARPRSDIA